MDLDITTVRAVIDSDKNRKYTAQMLYDFYLNDIDEVRKWMARYMTGKFGNETDISVEGKALFSDDTAMIIPKNHKDFVGKVLKNLCSAYNNGVDRYLVNAKGDVDEDATDLLNELYAKANIEQAQLEWYKQGKLMNVVEVKPVWRNVTQQVEFDIWTPNFFSVWENAESRLYKDLILFETERILPDATVQSVREVWTPKEHYLMVGKSIWVTVAGKQELTTEWIKEFLAGNPEGKNPYGVIPSQELRFRIGDDYYGEGMQSLVENNIWYDIMENNRKLVAIYQGLGIIFMVNMGKKGDVSITPYTALAVDEVKDGSIPPSIQSVATQAPLEQMRLDSIEEAKNIALMQGLSSQAFQTETTDKSGVSKAYDAEERDINQLEDKIILKDFERKLFNIFRIVNNYHNPDMKIDESLEFKCDFIEKQTPLNMTDQLKKWDWEIQKNASSIIDYMITQNPDLTVEEAKKQLGDNKAVKDEFQSEPIVDNTNNNPNDNTGTNS